MELSAKADFRNSFYDGMFANMFATLTGGVFLTGFALYLGMNEFMIGLLAATPFLVTIFQLPASYIIRKKGTRRAIAYFGAAGARIMWIPIVLVAFAPILTGGLKYMIVLSLFFLSHGFASVSYVAWLSWTSDLVPEQMRGRFFGTRNMLCGIAGMIVIIVFGNFVDGVKTRFENGIAYGFLITFISAVLLGLLSLRFLNRVSEVEVDTVSDSMPMHRYMFLPLEQTNFRRFLTYTFLWNFSVYFASPFFTLYFLRDLRFNYGFIAMLAMLSSIADLVGMYVWGRISDQVKNKPVIQAASWVAACIPLAWTVVKPDSVIMPILLHIIGGGFWAGINLCMNNLVLRISSQQNRAFFLSVHNIVSGLGAATGPILAGLALKVLSNMEFQILSWKVLPLQVIFVTSTVLRLTSLQFFKYVHEPEEATVGQMVRILRGVRGLNTANGFNYPLHPFLATSGTKVESGQPFDLVQKQPLSKTDGVAGFE